MALGAVLLRRPYAWALVAVATLAFAALSLWHRPLALPGLGVELTPAFTAGLLACFVLDAGLLVVFIVRISRNLRQRDAALAQLRQRAVEEEHIVRMGLLASGAAHELGTPLATLSVILGDWSRMAPFAAEPELREEIEEMQRQIDRCKAIVTGILTSAGETRAVAPVETTLHAFLDGLVEEWKRTRGVPGLAYEREGLDVPIISDTALQQMVANVLDNALRGRAGRAAGAARELGRRHASRCACATTARASRRRCWSGWARPTSPARARPGAGWACSSRSMSHAPWGDASRRTIVPGGGARGAHHPAAGRPGPGGGHAGWTLNASC